MFNNRILHLFVVLALALTFALMPQAIAFAGQFVDPATLNPPPSSQSNPVCEAVGSGTICHLAFTDPPAMAEPTGIFCDSGAGSFEILDSWTRSVEGRRYYDWDGNLTQRHFREVIEGTFLNPLINTAVPYIQSDTIIHNLAIPGNLDTGLTTSAGALRFRRMDGGIVLIDAGRSVIAADGSILMEAGQHPFDEYFVFQYPQEVGPTSNQLSLAFAL